MMSAVSRLMSCLERSHANYGSDRPDASGFFYVINEG